MPVTSNIVNAFKNNKRLYCDVPLVIEFFSFSLRRVTFTTIATVLVYIINIVVIIIIVIVTYVIITLPLSIYCQKGTFYSHGSRYLR